MENIEKKRQEVSAEEVAAAQARVLFLERNKRQLKKWAKRIPHKQRQKAKFELKMLSVIAKIFAIGQTFENVPVRDAILTAFTGFLMHESVKEFALTPEEFFSALQQRAELYEKAWKTPHHEGPFWMIGKTCAEIVDPESAISAIMTFDAAMWFQGELTFTIQALKGIKDDFEIVP